MWLFNPAVFALFLPFALLNAAWAVRSAVAPSSFHGPTTAGRAVASALALGFAIILTALSLPATIYVIILGTNNGFGLLGLLLAGIGLGLSYRVPTALVWEPSDRQSLRFALAVAGVSAHLSWLALVARGIGPLTEQARIAVTFAGNVCLLYGLSRAMRFLLSARGDEAEAQGAWLRRLLHRRFLTLLALTAVAALLSEAATLGWLPAPERFTPPVFLFLLAPVAYLFGAFDPAAASSSDAEVVT
jgi:hypothetical protein